MTRQFQYQSTTQIFRALTQPVAPNGWEVVAPPIGTRGKKADDGSYAVVLRSLAQAAPPNGWDVIAPYVTSALRAKLAGSEWYPATVAVQTPYGWDPVSPVLSALHSRPTGSEWVPATLPAIAPQGWPAMYLDTMPRRPRDHGAYADVQRYPAQPTTPNGWQAVYVDRAIRGSTAQGLLVELQFAPPIVIQATGPLFIEMAMTWTGGAAMAQVWTSGAAFAEVHYGD